MEQVQQLRSAFAGLPRRAQIAILTVAVVTVLALFFILRASMHTSWTPVLSGQKAGAVGKAQDTLTQAKIANKVSASGDALLVHSGDVGTAKAKLGAAGIGSGMVGKNCEDSFSSGGSFMSSTSEQMNQRVKSCTQNELASQVEALGGIKSASVILNLPAARLFTDEQLPGSATVSIGTDGASRISRGKVKAIQNIVAAGVTGVKPSAVKVTDEHGLLSGSSLGKGGTSMDEATLKLRITQDYKEQVEADLTRKFESLAGPGKVVVLANPTLDMDKVRREVKDYGGADNQQGPAAAESTKVENLNGTGAAAIGTTGTSSNVATGTQASTTQTNSGNAVVGTDTSGTGSKGYQNASKDVTYSNDEVAEARDVARGAVTTNRISVVVDNSVPTATVNAIKNAAQAWEGGNANDSFSFDEAPIYQAMTDTTGSGAAHRAALAAYLKWLVAGLGLIGMAFLLRRQLNQRTEELLYPIEEPYQLEQANFEPIPLAELEAAVAAATSVENQKRLELQRKVEKIADDKPADVATQLRGWMMEDADQYGFSGSGSGRR